MSPEWDIGLLDKTSAALEASCPSCQAYLHSYASVCFGCGHERGSGYLPIFGQWTAIATAPIHELRRSEYLGDEVQSLVNSGNSEPDIRRKLWLALRGATGYSWPSSLATNFNYMGGLSSAPHGEYIHLGYVDGRIVFDGDRSGTRLASVKPSAVLAIAPYGTLDEVLGGRTFGFMAGGAIVLQSVQPTEGGAFKFVFADDLRVWRLAFVGNRTGLTDKRYGFEFYQKASWLIGQMCISKEAEAEWDLGPAAYAESLGFEVPDEAEGEESERALVDGEGQDSKVCPDCAETVKAAARICRFCRHEFSPE